MTWQPIDTAPLDGTQIIAPSQLSGLDADIVDFTNGEWWSSKLEILIDPPKYWMAIPELPKE